MTHQPVQRVIARYQNGLVLKGHTRDFQPTLDRFHLLPADCFPGTPATEVLLSDLKGVFFVHRLDGDPAHRPTNEFEPTNITPGLRIRVVFKDGEVLHGTTPGYGPDLHGFFLLPADERSNNERCFVLAAATTEVSYL
jgi:hypothetical protein